MKDIQIDLNYNNQNVRGCQALKKGQSLILCTVRNIYALFYATSYIVSVIQVVKYHWTRLDDPIIMAGPKPLLTELGIHHSLESCEWCLI